MSLITFIGFILVTISSFYLGRQNGYYKGYDDALTWVTSQMSK